MEEIKNVTPEEVAELIKNFPIKPYRNSLVITVNVEEADGDLVLSNGQFSESQYVLAVGDYFASSSIKPGDKVLLDLEKMMEYTPSDTNSYERIGRIKLKPLQVDDTMYAFVSDSYILAIDQR